MNQPKDLLGHGATFISYAQNAEDVVLWRALRHITNGTYVDVGACDPMRYSVTKAFYDRGWSGINVVPAEEYAGQLSALRPRDTTLHVAAGASDGPATFNLSHGTGPSSPSDDRAERDGALGFGIEKVSVDVRRLDGLIAETPLANHEIHFLKIDVEGAEAAVLAGIDLSTVRPWVIVIGSTEPFSAQETDGEWRPALVAHNYTHALFDGLNSIFVAGEHIDLLPLLTYPAGAHDQPYVASQLPSFQEAVTQNVISAQRSAQRLVDELTEKNRVLEQSLNFIEARRRAQRHEILGLNESLSTVERERDQILVANQHNHSERDHYAQLVHAIHQTLSWRITKPIRVVRRFAGKSKAVLVQQKTVEPETNKLSHRGSPLSAAALARLRQVAVLIDPDTDPEMSQLDTFDQIGACLVASALEPTTSAWLVLVAAGAAYPNDIEVAEAARALRLDGPQSLFDHATRFFANCCRYGRATDLPLEIISQSVLVDVSHTAAHSLHTGIQRVARETVSEWVGAHDDVVLVHWDFSTNSPKRMSDAEVNRFVGWREHLAGDTTTGPRDIGDASGRVVIPWNSVLVIPELAAEADRCNGYRTMRTSGICQLSMIAYDLIPYTAPETVADGMPTMFANAVTVTKAADRISAISKATATEYTAFCSTFALQGLVGPNIAAHPLPSEVVGLTEQNLADTHAQLGLGRTPLVLVLGSHEPRKNHISVLEAAESLWRGGLEFQLVFVGGSGWKGDEFNNFSRRLIASNRDIQVIKSATENQIWSLYRLAEFTVFPSLLEGFGLPIAESLASGTPVITSNYGSMHEVGDGGGAVMVDPRVPSEIADAMRKLLTDPIELNRLRLEAKARQWPTWKTYSADVWAHLVPRST